MTTLIAVVVGVVLAVGLAHAALDAVARERTHALHRTPRVLPDRVRGRVAAALVRADLDIAPEAAVRWWLLGFGCAAWFTLLLAPPLLVPSLVGVAVGGPIGLRLRSGHADRLARRALAGLLDSVVAQLRAGGSVIEAVEKSAHRKGPLRPDCERMAARLALGATLEQVLDRWTVERPIPGVRAAAGALAMVTTMGGSAATALDGLVESLRSDEAARQEAKALSAQARVSAIVVGAAPLAYLVFATATDPASSRVLVSTPVGQICLAVGLGMEVVAGLWMRALLGPTT